MDELDLVYQFGSDETRKLELMAKLYQLMMKEDNWLPTYRIGSDWDVHHWTNRKYTKEEMHFME